MASLSGSEDNLDVASGTSIGCAQLEFHLPLPTAAGVQVLVVGGVFVERFGRMGSYGAIR